ncbi:MAG: dephospho-CoA kinase [FCB group bacterium]|nr:dephospho-CoA kinase [FCB group bacterium]
MILGLTGLIGSGKSEVAAVFGRLGAEIISGDDLGREVIEHDSVAFYRLVVEFGPTILNPNRTLNRRALGLLAFASAEKTEILNEIVHPGLLNRLDQRIARVRARGGHAVVDAALLIAWNYNRKMDYTILVNSISRLRQERLLARGLTEEEIRRRTKSQLSLAVLRRESNLIITNNKDLADLRKKAEKMYLGLIKRG